MLTYAACKDAGERPEDFERIVQIEELKLALIQRGSDASLQRSRWQAPPRHPQLKAAVVIAVERGIARALKDRKERDEVNTVREKGPLLIGRRAVVAQNTKVARPSRGARQGARKQELEPQP